MDGATVNVSGSFCKGPLVPFVDDEIRFPDAGRDGSTNRAVSTSPSTPRHDPLAALRQPQFAVFALSRLTSGMGMTLVQAAIAWQVYQLSGSPLQLGVVGLIQFLPALMGLSLLGGAFADSHDRRLIAAAAHVAPLATSTALLVATAFGGAHLGLIYGVVLVMAVASAFENPARQSLLISVVRRDTFQNAVTVNTTVQQLGFVTGPAVGGLVIAASGVGGAYIAHIGLVVCSLIALLMLRPLPREGEPRRVSVEAIKEGIQFVFRRQVLLGAMTLDMFAVIFGGATALLPVYAKDILHVGALGYGLLAASLDIGAFAMSLALVFLPPIQRTGRALLIAVAGFGAWTIVFGLSRSFPLALLAYMMVGASDQISVVMRHTTVQLATPDELRGRVTSVSQLFIGASNQLGRVESGFVAAATSATFAVVTGGAGCLMVLGAVAKWMPDLQRYRVSSVASHSVVSAANAEKAEEEEAAAAAG